MEKLSLREKKGFLEVGCLGRAGHNQGIALARRDPLLSLGVAPGYPSWLDAHLSASGSGVPLPAFAHRGSWLPCLTPAPSLLPEWILLDLEGTTPLGFWDKLALVSESRDGAGKAGSKSPGPQPWVWESPMTPSEPVRS